MIRSAQIFIVLLLLHTHGIYSQSISIDDSITEVIILHTNDVHGNIDYMPRLYTLLTNLRHEYKNVLLVSAGDIFSGNPANDQYSEKGFPIIDLMNRTGYNVSTIGNHAFDYGQENFSRRQKQADFDIICANILVENHAIQQPEPYKLYTMENGLRVGFIGLTQVNDDGLPDAHPDKIKGLTFQDGIIAAKKYNYLRDSVDILIALSHLGFENDLSLAEEFCELDVIIGGHSHRKSFSSNEKNHVFTVQAGYDLEFLGMLEIKLKDGKIIEKTETLIDLFRGIRPDEGIKALIEEYYNNEELKKIIGKADCDIIGKEELGSLMTDAITSLTDAEIAFQNNGGIRLDKIPAGDISVFDVHKLDPFNNEILLFNLRISEIKELLRYSWSLGPKGQLQVSGIAINYYGNSDVLIDSIVISNKDGLVVSDNKTYTVGLNSYISKTYEVLKDKKGLNLYQTSVHYLTDYIQKQGSICYKDINRISNSSTNSNNK